jgi:serine/threonine-protein kinase
LSDQKICPTCGTEYPLSERFCPRDGTALRGSNTEGDLIGSVVAERYHVLKKLGEGGMGTVYLAEHVKMGRKAALKVMNPGMNTDADAIARFNREAANASRLNHPNVCGIYDFGETPDGLIYLAMEFVEGESLMSLISKNGSLPAARAASIIHQAADALALAHDYGIVHRDLKPDNIMIAKGRDGGDLVKVVDFGIAKAATSDAQKVTRTGLIVGTPEYMSPEQLAGDKLDGRSDIYSLGLVAFNCLTGRLPFPSESAQEAMIMRLTDKPKTLAEMKPDVEWPPELQAVIDKALAVDANDRYQQSAEFGRDIAKAVEHMPADARSARTVAMAAAPSGAIPKTRMAPGSSEASPGRVKRSPVPKVAAALVVVATIGTVLFLKGRDHSTSASPAGSPGISRRSNDTSASKSAQTNTTPSRGAPAQSPGTVKTMKGDLPSAPGISPGPISSTSPGAAVEDAVATITRWQKVFEDTDHPAGELQGRQAIAALNPLIEKLSGQNRSNAVYVRMLAYGVMDSDELFCRAYAEVLNGDANTNHLKTAAMLQQGRGCK